MSLRESDADVCIVGLGAAGAMAAYELTRVGLSVIALDAGPARTGREFAMDELQSALLRNAWGTPRFHADLPTWRRNPDAHAGTVSYHGRMANGPGGSSVTYGGVSFRLHPDDFRARSATIDRYGGKALPPGSTLADWPLRYEDLEPFYDQAEYLLGVSGQAGNVRGQIIQGGNPFEGSRERPYPLPPLRISGYGELFAEITRELGYHPFPLPTAILSEPFEGRPACTYCSFCTRSACHVGAKGSVLETVIPKATKTGLLSIQTNCRALRVQVDSNRLARGVEYVGPNGPSEIRCRIVVLASYTFENVRLLLLSRDRLFPGGLGNSRDQVGRHYMARQLPAVAGVLDGRRLNRFIGPAAQGQVFDDLNADNFDHANHGFIRGGRIYAVQQQTPIIGSAQVPPGIQRWGRPFKEFLRTAYNSVANLSVDAETLPYEQNRLDLDPSVVDASGRPLIRISFDIGENEHRLLGFLQERAVEILRAMGASTTWRSPLFTGALSTHDMGGVRMGVDPTTSVVDRHGRLHDSNNVFVLGGCTFPTMSGMNPTLTIQALALRSAKAMAADLGQRMTPARLV